MYHVKVYSLTLLKLKNFHRVAQFSGISKYEIKTEYIPVD